MNNIFEKMEYGEHNYEHLLRQNFQQISNDEEKKLVKWVKDKFPRNGTIAWNKISSKFEIGDREDFYRCDEYFNLALNFLDAKENDFIIVCWDDVDAPSLKLTVNSAKKYLLYLLFTGRGTYFIKQNEWLMHYDFHETLHAAFASSKE